MENLDFTNIKKVLLIGSGGKTGYWYSRLLLKNNIEVFAYDENPLLVYDKSLEENPLFHKVSPDEGKSLKIISKVDSVSLSPGVSLQHPLIQKAREEEKFIFSELEFCFPFLKNRKWICVTGTDGKSTTVSLLEHCINVFSRKAVACGNIGLSFSRILVEEEMFNNTEFLVAELSSYQLELCRNLESDVSLYLNIAPDHLDRYPDLHSYAMAKWNIARALKKGGRLVANKNLLPDHSSFWENPDEIKKIMKEIETISVDTKDISSFHFYFKDNSLYEVSTEREILKTGDLKVQGNHNLTNILFCLEALEYFKFNDNQIIKNSLETFQSLPHRYERLKSSDGNIYINDSKATTTQAALIAVNNSKSPLFVFLGGKSKGESYDELALAVKNKNAYAFLYGQNRNEISLSFKKINYEISAIEEKLEEIFQRARNFQNKNNLDGVTYLLSPASTSWDQYSSFEERGDHFKKIVEKTAGSGL